MKKALVHLAVLTLATASLVHGADTPAAIAADYRAKAATALAKVNDTLEKATVPLVAALVKSGDTAGADLLKEQLKAKIAGEPVAMPQPTAAALFKSYDAARAKALEPAQQTAVKRIDAVLASSEGKKLDVVSELGKVRAEVETGKAVTPTSAPLTMPSSWDYYSDPGKSLVVGNLIWNVDGTLALKGTKNNSTPGRWEPTNNPKVFKVFLTTAGKEEQCELRINGNVAELERPIGIRYLTAK